MQAELSTSLVIQAEQAYRDVISDPRAGRRRAEAIATAARGARAREALVVALRAAGWAARELYEHDHALRHLNEAVRVARRTGLLEQLCETLIVRSAAFLELGRAGLARRDLAVAREVANTKTHLEVTLAEALLEDTVGNFSAAAAANRQALAELGGDRPELRVKALNNLALEVARFGEYGEAEQLLDEALELANTFSPTFAGFVTESQAIVAVSSGRSVEALRRYERAEERLIAVGAQLVDLYLGKADALFTLQLLDEAAAAADQAVAQVDGVTGGSLMLAEALLPKARIALARQKFDEAADAAARAEELFRRQRRTGWRAFAALVQLSARVAQGEATSAMLGRLRRLEGAMGQIGNGAGAVEAGLLYGEVAVRLQRPTAAADGYSRAVRAAIGGTVLVRLRGRVAAARRAEIIGATRRLGQVCRRGLDDLNAYRSTFGSAELRARAAAHGRELAEIGLRAALRAGRPEQIWYWLERGHAMVFLRGPEQPDEGLQPLLNRLRALDGRLTAFAPDAAPERADVLRQIAAAERSIRNSSWTRTDRRAGWVAPSVGALRNVRRALGDRVLLQYGVVDGRLHAVGVAAGGLRSFALGDVGEVTGAGRHLAFALRRLSQPRSAAAAAAAFASAHETLDRLTATLLEPFAAVLADAEEVIIATHGELIGIPWGVLGQLRDRPVRVVPSAVAWLRSRVRRRDSDRVVLVGGPDLAEAADEVSAIARCYHDDVELLTGDRASCEAVRRATTGAGVVHIACHGRLRADSPTFSSMRLSDGPLTVHDLEDLPLPAHHWILAACDLGRPGALVGPELEGVLAALLSGGAGAVIAAIVSVPDLSTRQLMVALHACLAEGHTPAEALRRARATLDLRDPSGFVAATAFSCYGGG